MSNAEEKEAGRRAFAERQGYSVVDPEPDGPDKNQAGGGGAEIEGVADGMQPAIEPPIIEPNVANPSASGELAELSGSTATALSPPAHDKDMASRFLAALDPNATWFTFQFFGDCSNGHAEILHGTLDEVWAKVELLNTPQRGIGIFVTINETDGGGRSNKNIMRARALFVDADSEEQGERCYEVFKACGATPSIAVKSGRGRHFYFCTDVPRDQFSALQKSLIDKVGTDAAVKDLPRVMRLPGTLHLKDPAKPRLVKLLNLENGAIQRWQLSDLVAKLGLLSATTASDQRQSSISNLTKPLNTLPNMTDADRVRLRELFGPPESLAIETNIGEIRSAVAAIPPTAISTEPDWMKLARGLAHEAAINKGQAGQLWRVLDSISIRAPGYDQTKNRHRWLRYIREAFRSDNPITIATVLNLAGEHGWQGWSPPVAAVTAPMVWSEADLRVSFSKVPHRRWLYGTYLIRGEVTVLAAPGGAGKTALATGMVVEIATGTEILGEKIFGCDLKVLFINGEDGGAEITRRVWAFCLAHTHKVPVQGPDRLYVAGANDPRVQRLSFLRTTDRNVSMVDSDGFNALDAALEEMRPDLLVLDPLVVFCGGGNMNDNAVMALVIRELKRLAAKFDCAILIVHHTRKGADDGNAEAISGASAIVNLARRAIMPVPMTGEEATALGVFPSERTRHFKLVDAKSNLAPRSAHSPWYRLHSVELPNPEPPVYPYGDNVQAVQRVNLSAPSSPAAQQEVQKIRDAILDLIKRGKMIDGRSYPYSPSSAGANKERALLDDAMAAVRKASAPRDWLPEDLKAATLSAIKKMKTEGLLITKDMKALVPDPGRFRKARGLAVASDLTLNDRQMTLQLVT